MASANDVTKISITACFELKCLLEMYNATFFEVLRNTLLEKLKNVVCVDNCFCIFLFEVKFVIYVYYTQ